MKNKYIPSLLLLLSLASCSSLKPEDFKSTKPNFDIIHFFSGHTHSEGVIEARSGKPSERIVTKTTGIYADGMLNMEQDVFLNEKLDSHRSFKFKLTDEHHVESTGSDISGTATGSLYGNYFTWSYRFKLGDKGFIKHVKISQYMYLMNDGKTLIVRSVFKKFGIVVKEITEQFHKDD